MVEMPAESSITSWGGVQTPLADVRDIFLMLISWRWLVRVPYTITGAYSR